MTSVTAASAAVRSTEPVPPPLTNSKPVHLAHRGDHGRAAPGQLACAGALHGADRGAVGAAPRWRVADPRDVRFVGHEPDELDARPRRRVGRERGSLLGRAHR